MNVLVPGDALRAQSCSARLSYAALLLALLALCGCFAGCNSGNNPGPGEDAADDVNDTSDTDASDSEATDDDGWELVVSGDERGAFLSVWGAAPNDVYVVGGTDDAGHAMHFDGNTWEAIDLPDGTPQLNWVFGVDDSVWMAGTSGAILVLDSDGEWEDRSISTSEPIWGIWGTSEDNMYAVGGDAVSAGAPTTDGLVFRWDGAVWNSEPLPDIGEPLPDAFFKVWGTSADELYVVGGRGVILKYDGSEWTGSAVAPFRDLVSLWGTADGDVLISGGRQRPVLLRAEGSGWKELNTTSISSAGMNGTWMDANAELAYSAGVAGTILRVELGTESVSRETVPTTFSLHGLYGFTGGPVFAVGGNLQAGSLGDGVIVAYEGDQE